VGLAIQASGKQLRRFSLPRTIFEIKVIQLSKIMEYAQDAKYTIEYDLELAVKERIIVGKRTPA
jgi:hypothetical protein